MSAVHFFFQSLANFKQIGSLIPSSRSLCVALTSSVQSSPTRLSVLEAGSGTGVVAEYMLAQKLPLAQLDVVESNPELYSIMNKALLSHGLDEGLALNKVLSDVVSFLDEDGSCIENRYDVIISSIPLNSLRSDDVLSILEAYKLALKPKGELCFYEYIGSRLANRVHAFFTHEIRFNRILTTVFMSSNVSESFCMNNFPPARIVKVKLTN